MKSTQLCALSGAFGALFATAGGACSEFAMLAVAETHHDLVKTVVEVSCTEDPVVIEHENGHSWVFAEIPVDVTAKDDVNVAARGHSYDETLNGFVGEKWSMDNNFLLVDDQGPDFVYCGYSTESLPERTSFMITIIQ